MKTSLSVPFRQLPVVLREHLAAWLPLPSSGWYELSYWPQFVGMIVEGVFEFLTLQKATYSKRGF